METNSNGMRCRAVRELRTHRGLIKKCTEGTIQDCIENLGRRLIGIRWDSGITEYAFPSEIEIIPEQNVSMCVNQ
jgi:hypothetical protein